MLANTLRCINPRFVQTFFRHLGVPASQDFRVQGLQDWNSLIDLSDIFDFYSTCYPIDRTQTINQPVQTWIGRAWAVPTQPLTLEQALSSRVQSLLSHNLPVNIFWSGGVDSTTAITAFLKYGSCPDQIRVVHTNTSVQEHPEYLKWLHQQHPKVSTVNLDQDPGAELDGIVVTGDGGDESHGNIDRAFVESHGMTVLDQPWQDFFQSQGAQQELLDFCEKFFAHAGIPIRTVLEARWWYYAMCHVPSALNHGKVPGIVQYHPSIDLSNVQGFLDCAEYDSFIYFNLEKIHPGRDYNNWRSWFKQYCYDFDGLEHWYQYKRKTGSGWYPDSVHRRLVLDNQNWIAILESGEIIRTPNLPLVSVLELDVKYQQQLHYLKNL